MVLTRAFACGTPVIASDIPGYRDVMTPETSLAVPPGDPAALADAVDERCSPTRRRARTRARRPRGSRSSATRGTTSRAGSSRSTSGGARGRETAPRHDDLAASVPRARALGLPGSLALIGGCSGGAGRTGTSSTTRSKLVTWRWVVLASRSGSTSLSVLVRALAWNADDRPGARCRRRSPASPGLLGVRGRPARERGAARGGSGSSRASRVLRRHLPRGRGASGTLVGTVFAHRLFDLVPALLLIGVRAATTAKVPHWAVTSLVIVVDRRHRALHVAFVTRARHHRPLDGSALGHPPAARDGPAGARRAAHAVAAPLGAILLQCAGWLMQLFAVYVSMRAFDIHAPLPAAGLVLLLMNVATIFPLWPGNIGLLQAAVALPLVQYGVPYSVGFAYALVLQVIEMSVGVGVGLIFLAREGLSFAKLREMPEEGEVPVDVEGETHPPERRRARARVPG